MTDSPSPSSRSSGRRFHSDDQGQLQPLEVAIHLGKTDLSQPAHLLAEPRQPVGRVVFGPADLAAKALVKTLGGGTHEIEVREDPARREQSMDFSKQLSLALVFQVMNRQSGDDDVSRPRVRELVPQVVSAQTDQGVAVESLLRSVEHWRGRVEPYRFGLWMTSSDERQQPPVAGAEVKESLDSLRQRLQQHLLSDMPMRYLP